MTKTAKTVLSIIVLVIIVGGLIWYGVSSHSAAPTASTADQSQAMTTDNSTPAMTSASDSSDAALNQDMTSVNGQMTGLNSDSATVDQGLNASQQ